MILWCEEWIFLIFCLGTTLAGPRLKFIEFFSSAIFGVGQQQVKFAHGRRTNLTSCCWLLLLAERSPNFLFSRGGRGRRERAGRRKIGRLVGTECIGHEKLATKWAVMIPQREQECWLISTVFAGRAFFFDALHCS